MAQGMSQKDAHAAAGYKGQQSNGPSILANRPLVRARVDYLRQKTADRAVTIAAVSRAEVIQGLRDNIKEARAGVPVLDRNGEPTGVTKPDFSAVNRGYEAMGRSIGMFVDVTREENFDEALDDMKPGDVEILLRSLLEQLDPNMRKKFAPLIEERPALEAEVVEPDSDKRPETLQ